MQDRYKRYKELAYKWLKGTITPAEAEEYNQWYHGENQSLPLDVDPEIAHSEKALKQKILTGIRREAALKKQPVRRRIYTVVTGIAAAMLLLVAAYWYLDRVSVQKIYPVAKIKDPEFKNDVLPGETKAVLTLPDGRKIALNSTANGILAVINGTEIIKTRDGKITCRNKKNTGQAEMMTNIISTPAGGQYEMTLSDDTKVWLNAGSSITYPTSFTGKLRSVSITGEAYFEVAKNPAKPFIVSADNMNVKVLGTHFNVNAYRNERAINTTLLEGRVEVINKANGHISSIMPGQQAQFSRSGDVKVTEANTENAVAWKNGIFEFDKTDIKSLMKQVARWYNINVTYSGPVTKDLFTGTIPRNVALTELLTMLKYAKVHFRLDKNNLTVLP